MPRRKNFGFERRQRETLRRTKQEAKRERIAERASQGGAGGPEMGAAQETGPPPGQWEWFSASRGRVVATDAGQRPAEEAPDDWVLLTETSEDEEPGELPS
jgi:hypothetical protein